MKRLPQRFGQCASQQGQAMAEGLIVLMVLVVLWYAVSWLGTVQDMALQVRHASRYMAFSATRSSETQALEQMRLAYFSGPGHQWWGRGGQRLQSPGPEQVRLVSNRSLVLPPEAQPGGKASAVSLLRTELGTADRGILRQTVELNLYAGGPAHAVSLPNPWASTQAAIWPVLHRQTSILTGAGHAVDDLAVQQQLSGADTAWAGSARASYGLAARIDNVMGAVDAGWQRRRPAAEWLQVWAGRVPEHHLLP